MRKCCGYSSADMYYRDSLYRETDRYNKRYGYEDKYAYEKGYGYDRARRYGPSMEMELDHYHNYSGRTAFAGEGERFHDHGFYASTGRGRPVRDGKHVHGYSNRTTVDLEHRHNMTGTTGVNVFLPGGKHVHYDMSVTSFDVGHRHGYKFRTSTERKPYYIYDDDY